MAINQRRNFASFLAKLSAVGVTDDKLCGCALILLRDTLESARPLDKIMNNEITNDSVIVFEVEGMRSEQNNARNAQNLSIAELQPAANAWLAIADQKLIQLSEAFLNTFPTEVGMLGELARAKGGIPQNGGFSPQRWLFWVNRLEEIAKSKSAGT